MFPEKVKYSNHAISAETFTSLNHEMFPEEVKYSKFLGALLNY